MATVINDTNVGVFRGKRPVDAPPFFRVIDIVDEGGFIGTLGDSKLADGASAFFIGDCETKRMLPGDVVYPGNVVFEGVETKQVKELTVLFIRPFPLKITPHLPPKAKPEQPPKDVEQNKAPRSRWINESYDTTIYQVDGKRWAERENKTGTVKWDLEETARTDDYIELRNAGRGQTWRVFARRIDLKDGDGWKWLSNGRWDGSSAKASPAKGE